METQPSIRTAPASLSTASAIRVAAQVISVSSREKPADATLREALRREHELSATEARDISRTVFAYYRWLGWLNRKAPIQARLRQALEHDERFRKNPFSLPVDQLRAKAIPAWVVGEVTVEDEWLRTLQREPKLWLRARRGEGRTLTRKLRHARIVGGAGMPETILYEGREDLFVKPEFQAGEFEIQDITSQAVGWVCDPRPGETWWDACAGEGGKTLHLADLMENKGLIWASDRAAWRLQILKRRAARARVFNYRAAPWDGGPRLPTKTRFDGVLVDAPCSGVGTWQRNPQARWTTRLEDVHELSAVQKRLLALAAKTPRPGGKIVYAVCSMTRSETVDVADDFEARFPQYQPLPVVNPLQPDLPAAARLWLWPQHCGGNGMFIAVWKRISAHGS